MQIAKLKENLYILLGSFEEVEEIKATGARWNSKFRRWECGPEVAARAFQAGASISPLVKAELIEYARKYEKMLQLSSAVTPSAGFEVPSPPTCKFYDFQKAGIEYLQHTDGRGILGDDMGIGKTMQAIGWLNLNPTKRPVVVVTTASMKIYWARKLEEWLIGWWSITPIFGQKTVDLLGTDFVIINYDIVEAHLDALKKLGPQVVILDEAHNIKNAKARRTKATAKLCKKVPHVLAVTGTFILNRPIEGWTVLNLLRPDLFNNWRDYVVRYCGGHQDRYGHWRTKGATNKEEFHDLLRSHLMVRRQKHQVLLQLPDKTRTILELEVPGAKPILKDERTFLVDLRDTLQKRKLTRRAISKLPYGSERKGKQSLFNTAVVNENMGIMAGMQKLRHEIALRKVPVVVEFVDNILNNDEKVVIFAYHQDVIEALQKALPKSVVVSGTTPGTKRQELQDQFQTDPNIQVFIGSIRACREGIDLTAASHVVFAELDWVPGYMRQAEDRCHRIGQKDNVNIYYLLTENSLVEQQILETLQKKQPVIDGMLDGEGRDNPDETMFQTLLEDLAALPMKPAFIGKKEKGG